MKHLFHVALLILCIQNGVQCQHEPELKRFEFSHGSMGSVFKIICYGDDFNSAEASANMAFDKLDSLNLSMSDYLPYSELHKLCNMAGKDTSIQVSQDLFKVLALSQKWADISDGDFDISIGVLSQLWRRAGRKDKKPDDDEIKKALELVNNENIILDSVGRRVRLLEKGMFLDLGGIAKGYAVDRMFEIMQNNGYGQCLVDGGGDIRAGNSPPESEGWKISRGNDMTDPVYIISNQAVATSGDLYRYTEFDGIRYSHIIDPETGYGLTARREVTVFADNCTEADVLASILSIKGYPEGFDFLEKVGKVSAVILEFQDDQIKKYRFPKTKNN